MPFVLPVDELVRPVSPDSSCGTLDGINEGQIASLDEAIKSHPAQTILRDGNPVVIREAFEPPWTRIQKSALGLFRGGRIPDLTRLSESDAEVPVKPVRHLKVAVVLALTGLENDGLLGFSDGLLLTSRVLADFWEPLHPVADPEVPEDPYYGRANCINPLAFAFPAAAKDVGSSMASDSWRFFERLLKSTLLQSDRHGAVSVRDCLSPWAAALKLPLPAGEDLSAERVREIRLAAGDSVSRELQALQEASAAVSAIKSVFARAPVTFKPDFRSLEQMLDAMIMVLKDEAPSVAGGSVVSVPSSPSAPSGLMAAGMPRQVSSREDAVQKLAEAAEYFRRHEPSSPLPLMIDRLKRLAGLNFMSLVEELNLGDEAVKEFRKLAGVKDEPPTEGESSS